MPLDKVDPKDTENAIVLMKEAMIRLDKGLERLGTVQTQIGEHIIRCNSLQEAAQEWRKQINQRIIEVQVSQSKSEKQNTKANKKFNKKLNKMVQEFEERMNKVEEKRRKVQYAQLAAICGILLTVLGAILSESFQFSARGTGGRALQTQENVRGR